MTIPIIPPVLISLLPSDFSTGVEDGEGVGVGVGEGVGIEQGTGVGEGVGVGVGVGGMRQSPVPKNRPDESRKSCVAPLDLHVIVSPLLLTTGIA